MNTSDEINSTQESLAIITAMIQRTQNNMRGRSFHFIMWGWVTVSGYAGHYLLEKYTAFEHPYAIWLLVVPAWIASMIYGRKHARDSRVTNYSDQLIMWTWVGFSFSLLVLIFSGMFFEYLNGLILLMAGMATFSTGLIIRYKPLIIGGSLFWIFAAIALSVSFMTSFLVAAVAVIIGYLVPGYMLKNSKD
jgi:hypothetical protein